MAGKDQHNKLQIIIITNEEVRMGRGWLHVKRNIQRKKNVFQKYINKKINREWIVISYISC